MAGDYVDYGAILFNADRSKHDLHTVVYQDGEMRALKLSTLLLELVPSPRGSGVCPGSDGRLLGTYPGNDAPSHCGHLPIKQLFYWPTIYKMYRAKRRDVEAANGDYTFLYQVDW